MSHLAEDCLKIIFNELQYDSSTLYSCILVNRHWCRIAIPILWKNPSSLNGFSPSKLHNMIIFLLPKSSKKFLSDNIPKLSLTEISDKPLFDYISFFSQISPDLISKISKSLFNDKEYYAEEKFVDYYKYILEQEIYKLFIYNCKNLKYFYWSTSHPLSKYQGATTFFSQLCTLKINLMYVTTGNLLDMIQICQNIEHLEVSNCDKDIVGIVNFINIQRNLQSLCIKFMYREKLDFFRFSPLNDVIMKKAFTIKKFIASPFINLLSPQILPTLKNLQHLELNNNTDNYVRILGLYSIKDWDDYLSISSFPNLQYLKIIDFPTFNDYMLIEKSNGSILEINTLREQIHNPIYTNKLIISISECCPKIKKLTINIEPENLEDLKEIFLNCKELEMMGLLLDSDEHNGDKLLEIISEYSPETLCDYSFYRKTNTIFTTEGLENFFENWKKGKPLIFNIINNHNESFTEHDKIIKKYFDEGVIKEYNYLHYFIRLYDL